MSLYDGYYFALVTSTDLEHSTNDDIIEFALIEINLGDVNASSFHLPSTIAAKIIQVGAVRILTQLGLRVKVARKQFSDAIKIKNQTR